MQAGFDSVKDICEVLLIPAVGGSIALLWPWILSTYRRRRFEALIVRELEEVRPYPIKASKPGKPWTEHLPQKFIHQTIFESASENRDFILSLDPEVVYLTSQLWEAKRTGNSSQWTHCLNKLGDRFGKEKIYLAGRQWGALLKAYQLTVSEPTPRLAQLAAVGNSPCSWVHHLTRLHVWRKRPAKTF